MLKVACGIYFSRIAAKDTIRIAETHGVDLTKIADAFFLRKWEPRAGLYFNGHTGSVMTTERNIQISPLSDDSSNSFSGVRIGMLGLQFDLLFETAGARPGPWNAITRRPTELIFENKEREQTIILTWPMGTPASPVRFSQFVSRIT
jgi:hypothetical protein